MNVFHIIRKELVTELRDIRTFVFMIAFPIVLMIILGSALTNAFSSDYEMDSLSLIYKNNTSNEQLNASWSGFMEALEQEGVSFTSAAEETDGQKVIQEDEYTAYAELTDDGIQYYGNPKDSIENNIVQGMLTVFADQYNLMAAAVKADPAAAGQILAAQSSYGSFIQEVGLNPDKQPRSIDYYAITMSTMIALYSALSASYLIRGEVTRGTHIRLYASPVSKGTIFTGKVLASALINFLCVAVVVLFSKFVFQADWGSNYTAVFVLLFTEILLAVSLGLACSYLFKDGASHAVIIIIIQIASFVGGAYFPIHMESGLLSYVVQFSPLYWANQALIQVIFAGNAQAVIPVVALNVGLSALLLIFSAAFMRKTGGV
ncbi:ABC transporter permease [Neobacillus mesonae]|nr:ABC transporter permease [Neobacillus mesonae]